MRSRALSMFSLALTLISANLAQAKDVTAEDEGGCYSGGPGASSCSITIGVIKCNVSCQPPFFACCTLGGNCNCAYAM